MRNAVFAVLVGVLAFGVVAPMAQAQLPPALIPTAYTGDLSAGCTQQPVPTKVYVTHDPNGCDGDGSMTFSVSFTTPCGSLSGLVIGPVCPVITVVWVPGNPGYLSEVFTWSGSGSNDEVDVDVTYSYGYGFDNEVPVEASGFDSGGNPWSGTGTMLP